MYRLFDFPPKNKKVFTINNVNVQRSYVVQVKKHFLIWWNEIRVTNHSKILRLPFFLVNS